MSYLQIGAAVKTISMICLRKTLKNCFGETKRSFAISRLPRGLIVHRAAALAWIDVYAWLVFCSVTASYSQRNETIFYMTRG